MNLLEKQQTFTRKLAVFLAWLYAKGYRVTLGEAWRSPETCALYAKEGKGIRQSLHEERLAVDLNIFRDGMLLSSVGELRDIGEQWKELSDPEVTCRWGGDFLAADGRPKPDADHFSIEHDGVK